MLGLETQGLQLGESLLFALLALRVFLFLQCEYFFEGGFCDGRWDLVFPVQILRLIGELRLQYESSARRNPPTTSPSRSTFSPRTRKIPREISAYCFPA